MKVTDTTEKKLKEKVDSIDVFSFLSVQDFLSRLYELLKVELPRYSYRSYSKDLGFGETNYLHLICTHKRQLSMRSAQQVASHLGLHGDRRTWFLSLVKHTAGRYSAQRAEGIKNAFLVRQKTVGSELTRDEMEFFGRWYHAVVRELVARKDFNPDPKWICQKLKPKITPEQARQSLELQLRLGYVVVSDDNKYSLSHSHIRVPEGLNHLAIHKFHQEMLQLSERSLSEVDSAERDLSALTVRLNPEQMTEVKTMLREVRRRIAEMSSVNDSGVNIFQMNMQLFPVTESDK
jgi:uncharacterized protein (TIGR02147 family)